jgi:hypothetical protein
MIDTTYEREFGDVASEPFRGILANVRQPTLDELTSELKRHMERDLAAFRAAASAPPKVETGDVRKFETFHVDKANGFTTVWGWCPEDWRLP